MHVVLSGRAALGQDAAEQRQQVLLFRGQHRKIAAQVEVRDPVGGLRIELDPGRAEIFVAAGHVLELHRDVAQVEGGKHRQVRFGLLLRLQAQRLLDDALTLLVGEAGFDFGQALQLSLALPLLQLRVGHHREERAMRVVEQLGLDQVFEESALLTRLLEVLEVFVEIESAEGVAAIEVAGHRGEEHPERVGEAGVGALALLELEVVDRRVDLRGIDTRVRQALQSVEDDFLDFLGILVLDALEPGAEHRLLVVVSQPAAVGERAAQT